MEVGEVVLGLYKDVGPAVLNVPEVPNALTAGRGRYLHFTRLLRQLTIAMNTNTYCTRDYKLNDLEQLLAPMLGRLKMIQTVSERLLPSFTSSLNLTAVVRESGTGENLAAQSFEEEAEPCLYLRACF